MEEGKTLAKFVITCIDCQLAGRKFHTLLHVDWMKKYYMITCYKCDVTEAFNEKGERIVFEENKRQIEEEKKKEDEVKES